jgi:hypothetical protein
LAIAGSQTARSASRSCTRQARMHIPESDPKSGGILRSLCGPSC